MSPLPSIFVLFLISTCFVYAAEDDSLIVKTTKGTIKGIRLTSESGKPVNAFLGIPYAKPPTGKNRFKRPVPVDSWKNVLEANKKPNTCVQDVTYLESFKEFEGLLHNNEMNEDCLHLNVWVPVPRPQKAAVMVWIYGGGFNMGSSSSEIYDMKVLTSEENVIGVSLNYRISSLGFLYLNHPDAPGNAGLHDQILALQWVKENIAAFGGDPDKITIFGESAGSSSVSFHLLSPISQNYFNRAILQSGSSTAIFSSLAPEVAIQNGLNLAKSVNCPSDPNKIEATIECLQNTNPEDLIIKGPMDLANLPFAPVVDGVIVKEHPSLSISNGRFKNADILIGTTTDEGAMFVALSDKVLSGKELSLTREQFKEFIKDVDPVDNPLSQEAIAFEYTHWQNPEDGVENIGALKDIYGDLYFVCPALNEAQAFAEAGNKVFYYQFARLFPESPFPKWMGVPHAADLFYVFGKTLDKSKKFSAEEVEFNKRVLRYWSNFAKTGNPNTSPSGQKESIHWPPYTPKGREYLVLKGNTDKPHHALRARKCAFWDIHLPRLMELSGSEGSIKGFSVNCLKKFASENAGALALGLLVIVALKWICGR